MTCICNRLYRWAARYDNTNTHSINILLCGHAHGEVLPPDEANVSEDFTVPLRYFTQSCWAQWQSYETLKGRFLLNLCIMHPITIPIIFISTEYPGNRPGWKFKPGNLWPCLWEALIVQLEKEICFLIIKMSTDDANRCCWRILTYSWWSVFPWTSTRCPIHPNTM